MNPTAALAGQLSIMLIEFHLSETNGSYRDRTWAGHLTDTDANHYAISHPCLCLYSLECGSTTMADYYVTAVIKIYWKGLKKCFDFMLHHSMQEAVVASHCRVTTMQWFHSAIPRLLMISATDTSCNKEYGISIAHNYVKKCLLLLYYSRPTSSAWY